MRALIIEDDALIGMLLQKLLAEMGHEVCATATSEAAAVDAALRHKPDLMIVDARLGRGSGIAAVVEILRDGYVPHVFVSGDQPARIKEQCPNSVVLQKPFSQSEFARAIQSALDAAAP
jgi:two-component system, response regulator PdtaR